MKKTLVLAIASLSFVVNNCLATFDTELKESILRMKKYVEPIVHHDSEIDWGIYPNIPIQHGKNPFEQSVSALYLAINNHDYWAVSEFLEGHLFKKETIETNALNFRNQTALHAICDDRRGIQDGCTLEYYQAALKVRLEIIKSLLLCGFNVNQKDCYDHTPLFYFLHVNSNLMSEPTFKEIIHTLLDAEADPNITDKYGSGPLQYLTNAIFSDQSQIEIPPIVEILVKRGANPHIYCSPERTVYSYVRGRFRAHKNPETPAFKVYKKILEIFDASPYKKEYTKKEMERW